MRESMRDMMADAAPSVVKPHLIANNTIEYHRPDGTRVIRLHHTDIIEFLPDGKIRLNTQGWKTVTTKDRMNCLPGYRIGSVRGQWYVYRGSGWNDAVEKIAFYDGMILPDAFAKPAASYAEAKAAAQENYSL